MSSNHFPQDIVEYQHVRSDQPDFLVGWLGFLNIFLIWIIE